MSGLGAVLWLWGLVAEPAPAFDPHSGHLTASWDALIEAQARGDRAIAARLAGRLGWGGIVPPLQAAAASRSVDIARVRAALQALDVMPGAIRALGAVAPLVASADASIAVLAARTAGTLLDGREPWALVDWDVPPDAVALACRNLAREAAQAGRLPVREAAEDALATAVLCEAPRR